MPDLSIPILTISLSRRETSGYDVELAFDRPGDSAPPSPRRGFAEFDFTALRATARDPQAQGRLLSQALFHDPGIRQFFGESLAIAQAAGQPYRMRLRIHANAPELHGLRWETLCHPDSGDFLTQNANLGWCRELFTPDWSVIDLRARSSLRALLAVANPAELKKGVQFSGLPGPLAPVDVAGELRRARLALQPIGQIDELASPPEGPWGVTFDNLVAALGQGYDILYLVCHGALLPDDPADPDSPLTSFLLLELPDGSKHRLPGDLLVEQVKNLPADRRPRLVVLAACQSAGQGLILGPEQLRSADEGALAALGPRLAESGVPVVVAMQANITQRTVEDFMPVFFAELLRDGQFERAMAMARSNVSDQADWWMPVLFSRLKDGLLFREEKPPDFGLVFSALFQAAPIASSRRYRDFLSHYLGTPENPVPFGGRAAELQALDGWLLEPGQPPNGLLSAPLGRGKSALVVRWLTSVQERDLAKVVFVPVSARFGLADSAAFYNTLAALLSEAHNLPPPLRLSDVEMRPTCEALLARDFPGDKPLLVILDGLDEAASWELDRYFLPAPQPDNLRILISARSVESETIDHAWREQFGWESPALARSISLTKLTPDGIAQVLESMGGPLAGLASQQEIIAALFRLSDSGDPLLVQLYVDRLGEKGAAAGRLTKAGLDALEPGLGGYFKGWEKEQELIWGDKAAIILPGVILLQNILAVSYGPITKDDLLALIQPEDRLSGRMVDNYLAYIQRWIIGQPDPQANQPAAAEGETLGYVFQHPRLADYFCAQLPESERQALHRRFAAWGADLLSGLNSGKLAPEKAPAYILRYYSAHLDQTAAEAASYYDLVSRGWMQAWYALEGGYSGFLSDVSRAWSKADQSFLAGLETSGTLVEQIRCALSRSSVAALSSNIPTDLLVLLVQEGKFSPTQALVYISQISDEGQKSAAIQALSPLLGSQIAAGLALARGITNEYFRATTLTGLVPHLTDELKDEALAAVFEIEGQPERTLALSGLVRYLPKVLRSAALQEALPLARRIEDKRARMETLSGLAEYLTDELKEEILVEALEAVREIDDESARAEALIELAPNLPDDRKGEALATASGIGDEFARAEALSVLAGYLPVELIIELLTEARGIEDESALALLLSELVPYLPDEFKDEILALAWDFKEEGARALVLLRLAPGSSDELKREALASARRISDELDRMDVLGELAPHLPDKLKRDALEEALALARGIEDDYARMEALIYLADNLPDELKDVAIADALLAAQGIGIKYIPAGSLSSLAPLLSDASKGEALRAVQEIPDEEERALALSELTASLPDELKVEALAWARGIEDKRARAWTLSELAPHLPDELKNLALIDALAAAQGIEDKIAQAFALIGLASYLSDELKGQAMAAALRITDEHRRALSLIDLAPYLPFELKDQALVEALAATRGIGDEYYRARALSSLAPHLPGDLIDQILAVARGIGNQRYRAEILSGLAPHLPDELTGQALAAARGIEFEYGRALALSNLTPHLPDELKDQALAEALAAARGIGDENYRAEALIGLAPHLPDELKGAALLEALAAARGIKSKSARAQALSGLAPHLADELKSEVLAEALLAAQGIGNEADRAEALNGLAPHLPDELKSEVLAEALLAARGIGNVKDRALVLSGLAPYLPDELKSEVMAEALLAAWEIKYEEDRAEALSGLASHLPDELIGQALAAAQGINDELHRTRVLYELAPRLPARAEKYQPAASQAWIVTLTDLSRNPRPIFLNELSLLFPFALSLLPESNRPQAAAGIFRAIQEICSWWP